MSKTVGITLLVVGLVFLTMGGCTALTVVSTLDADATQKNRIEAQEETRNLYFDKLYKVIAQRTQITNASSEQQKELVEALVQGRAGGFVRLIQESNPESAFSRQQFDTLANSVEAQREGFFREQKELVDMVKVNEDLHDRVFSGMVLSIAGRKPAERPVLITSAVTEGVVASGTEDDIELGLE